MRRLLRKVAELARSAFSKLKAWFSRHQRRMSDNPEYRRVVLTAAKVLVASVGGWFRPFLSFGLALYGAL